MRRNQKCGHAGILGIVLISVGAGILLAYIIPYQFLIFLFGAALILWGIRRLCKK